MVDLSQTSEALTAEIQFIHDGLTLLHADFAEELGELLEAAQEVYVRDEIAKGLTAVATPGWDYREGCDVRADAEEDDGEDEYHYWFDDDEDY